MGISSVYSGDDDRKFPGESAWKMEKSSNCSRTCSLKCAGMNSRLDRMEDRLEKLEQQQAKTNVQLFELRGDIIRLAERNEQIVEHEKRIARLELTVYK